MSETDSEEYRFSKLTGKYKHYCLEYDGLAIDETCEEFKYCICFKCFMMQEKVKVVK